MKEGRGVYEEGDIPAPSVRKRPNPELLILSVKGLKFALNDEREKRPPRDQRR
jgi:hypothetical protein